MAKCDLSIELDDPERVYDGGSRIGGIVRVMANTDVQCDGLVVKSTWQTHGKGNVAKGDAGGETTIFEGQWKSGEQNEYRFDLPVAAWPPTYHGFHLNIAHSIDARAKVPWSFDPKASTEFLVRPSADAAAIASHQMAKLSGAAAKVVGTVFAVVFVSVFMVVSASFGVFGFLFLLIPIAGLLFYLIKFVLPKWALGQVECKLHSDTFQPGESISGDLVIHPRNRVAVGGISLDLQAIEKCVSGSGSNRTTHTHTVFARSYQLSEATTLQPNQENRFLIAAELPSDAAYSINLRDNDLIWSTKLRVELPRWPDFVATLPMRVIPGGAVADERPRDRTFLQPAALATDADATGEHVPEEAAITFDETVRHLYRVRGDRDQVGILVEAVSGMTFDIQAEIERRLLYAGDDDPHVYKDGFAVWARYPDPDLPMVLYVPHRLGDEFEQAGTNLWSGRGTVVGWDTLHGRLQVKLQATKMS